MGDLAPVDGVSLPNKVVAVAVSRDNNSKYAARWAISNLLTTHKNNPLLILIHVRKQHQTADVDSSAPDGHGDLIDADMSQLFKPFRAYCSRKSVQAKEVVLDDGDISEALLNYIDDNIITHIVLGASTRSTLQKQWRSHDIPTIINKSAPGFCSVYVITKTEIQSVRPAVVPAANLSITRRPNCQTMLYHFLADYSESQEEVREMQSTIPQRKRVRNRSTNLSMDTIDFLFRGYKNISGHNSPGTDEDNHEQKILGSHVVTAQNEDFTTLQESALEEAQIPPSKNIETKLRRMKIELKQTIGMYNRTCRETATTKKKVKEFQQCTIEEARKSEKARLVEEAALTLSGKEKAKCRAAFKAAEKAEKLANMEAARRRHAELKAKREAEAKDQALNFLSNLKVEYRRYTLEEIEAATDHFSNSLKIGEGGYGPVYSGNLDHTKVAIKVLGTCAAQGKKQFRREVQVLSCMRHPNLVLLLGACPQYGCLVYEYMNYGSLEDRLFRKGNTPPISWTMRFKIAADIATGLLFLHNAKQPIVHCDLKPANILLDSNYTCKISDVGLSRLIPASVVDNITQYRITSGAGTFCYIDPEYQQTGKLGVKSDIYSFGIMLLQILTARPPMGLIRHVERSISEGTFEDLLDPSVPNWPVEEAFTFAEIALHCTQIKQKDRPDLGSVVLPELERLKEFGSYNVSSMYSSESSP